MGWRRENGKLLVNSYSVSVGKDEEF
jgi:hypothetical protein